MKHDQKYLDYFANWQCIWNSKENRFYFWQDDFTIVSGDSRGKTSFWNGRTGTLVDSYQSHKADVLAVAVSQDQQVNNS